VIIRSCCLAIILLLGCVIGGARAQNHLYQAPQSQVPGLYQSGTAPPPSGADARKFLKTPIDFPESVDFLSHFYAAYAPKDQMCGCPYQPSRTSTDGAIEADKCGYQYRGDPLRGQRIDWMHVVSAGEMAQGMACWAGDQRCVGEDHKNFGGEACCLIVDPKFKAMYTDLQNIVPEVGEIIDDRENLPLSGFSQPFIPTPYGALTPYGKCTVGILPGKAFEPPVGRRGEVARIYL
jgi:endonuclease I